jgi:peptidoglycan/LPS O-acetylase OafA/YrhL
MQDQQLRLDQPRRRNGPGEVAGTNQETTRVITPTMAAYQHDQKLVPASSFRSDSPNLDIVRATAVLSVFFAHLHDIWTGKESMIGWHCAQIGVLIFFVHTSMVLMLSLERTKLEGIGLFASFYLRRFFRIYPLSVVCVTLAMVLGRAPDMAAPIRHWHWTEYLSNLMLTTNLTYTDNMVGGLWTLPLEVQMYVALPFLFLLGRAYSTRLILLLWALSVPLAMLQLHMSARLSVLGYAPCFIAGVIAWKLSLGINRRLSGWLWPFAFTAIWPLFLIATHENNMYFRWLFCLGLGLAIPWFREIHFPPLNVTAHFVAKYSYGIYLSHVAVIMWCSGLAVSVAARVTILAILAVIIPIAIFHLIEHPMIVIGQKLAKRIFQKPLGQSSQPVSAESHAI